MTEWFARPVLHVADVEASLLFYVNRLGFTSPWRYDKDGRAHVAQVDRQGCADPGRHLAGEDWQGGDVHFPERRASDARSCGRRFGHAARRARGQGRSGEGGFVGLPAPGGRRSRRQSALLQLSERGYVEVSCQLSVKAKSKIKSQNKLLATSC